jgi:excisionase family DNA binding protein
VAEPLTAADVMTAAEVAAFLRVPRSTVEDWARRGVIPSRRIGRRRIHVRSKIEAMLLDDGRDTASREVYVVPTGPPAPRRAMRPNEKAPHRRGFQE